MINLVFLDDERLPENVTWARYPEHLPIILRNFKEFCHFADQIKEEDLANMVFSFDHDLQDFNEDGSENTGLTCAKYLVEALQANGIDCRGKVEWFVHSQNVCGKKNIANYLQDEVDPFASCDGCGHTGPDVYHDGYGFNICRTNGCTQYSVRGLSPWDFL